MNQIQTRKTRDRILAAAHEYGELHRLVWVIMQSIPRDGIFAVGVRSSLITIPATPSPEVSAEYAHLTMEVVRLGLPRDRSLWLEVRDLEDLNRSGITWHTYGESDFVCPGCAAIGNDCVCQPTVFEIPQEEPSARKKHHRQRVKAVS